MYHYKTQECGSTREQLGSRRQLAGRGGKMVLTYCCSILKRAHLHYFSQVMDTFLLPLPVSPLPMDQRRKFNYDFEDLTATASSDVALG